MQWNGLRGWLFVYGKCWADHAVVDLACLAAVLPLDRRRRVVPLGVGGVIEHVDGLFAPVLTHEELLQPAVASQVVADEKGQKLLQRSHCRLPDRKTLPVRIQSWDSATS